MIIIPKPQKSTKSLSISKDTTKNPENHHQTTHHHPSDSVNDPPVIVSQNALQLEPHLQTHPLFTCLPPLLVLAISQTDFHLDKAMKYLLDSDAAPDKCNYVRILGVTILIINHYKDLRSFSFPLSNSSLIFSIDFSRIRSFPHARACSASTRFI